MAFKHTEETKRTLSEMHRGARNPMYGRKHTPEALAKIAAATTRRNAQHQYELELRKLKWLSEAQRAYVAGLVDGEGSVTHRRSRPSVYIYNTSLPLMEWLVANVGRAYRVAHRNGREPCYVWTVEAAADVAYLLTRIRPFLVIKGKRADEALAFLENKYGARLDRAMRG